MSSADRVAADGTSQLWDAVVVGAGPSGALAARQLALAGHRVLLVERKPFPRDKVCGGCVGRRALVLLESLGLPQVGPAQGGRPLGRLRLYRGTRRLDIRLSGGIAISRRAFDAALVHAAVMAGVVFRAECAAEVAPASGGPDEPRRLVVQLAERTETIAARVVLAADGLTHSSLRGLPAFASRVARRSRVGLGAAIASSLNLYEAGVIHMAVGRQGYAGLVRTEDDHLNVAAAIDRDYVRAKGGPGPAIAAILGQANLPIPQSLATARWQGTPPLTRCTPRLAERRLFVLGDAAGYVEPFTGEGIAWALAAAAAVAPLASQACTAWDDRLAEAWSRRFAQLIRRRQLVCRLLAVSLRHPWAVGTAWNGLAAMPGLANPLVRGLERLPWNPETGR